MPRSLEHLLSRMADIPNAFSIPLKLILLFSLNFDFRNIFIEKNATVIMHSPPSIYPGYMEVCMRTIPYSK